MRDAAAAAGRPGTGPAVARLGWARGLVVALTAVSAAGGASLVGASAAGADTSPCPGASSSTPTSCTFAYTGGMQTFTVPAAVSSLDVVAVGANGGANTSKYGGRGGVGASVEDTSVPVRTGDALTVVVGGTGGSGEHSSGGAGSPGGGGAGGVLPGDPDTSEGGAGGGGYSGLLEPDATPLVIAAGGGGGSFSSPGGDGDTGSGGGTGGASGGPGGGAGGGRAVGSSPGAGGAPGDDGSFAGESGAALQGGTGGTAAMAPPFDGLVTGSGGGGGGGYAGGGGGGGGDGAGAGGGGSSYGIGGLTNETPGTTAPTVTITFTVAVRATVTSLAPNAGPAGGGQTVMVTGTGFDGAARVQFGRTPAAFSVLSDTQLLVTSPAHAAGVVQVRVHTAAGLSAKSSAARYRYVDG